MPPLLKRKALLVFPWTKFLPGGITSEMSEGGTTLVINSLIQRCVPSAAQKGTTVAV